ncbi:hypothetical protein [Hymenobacter cavernae]|uniref:Collagen-like protein n=1 Tax=Hymenobacter cavernae TaxID=2044852 RepID=A0ABQ1UMN5_9BACT|nr:hypothetical protein [Hymenobacter cavernae]GGF22182.1 hypothetical protein GCM10011383_37260 [Hymenobacter cavernae]
MTGPELLEVFAPIIAAVSFLEGLSEGSRILHAPGAPDPTIGKDGDAYIDESNGDLHFNDNGAWDFRMSLRGPIGPQGKQGPIGPASTVPGPVGKSAYQEWRDAGNLGTPAQFLASLQGKTPTKGTDYVDGADGNKIHWESYAPTYEAGTVGDAWFYTISGSKLAIYEYIGPSIANTPLAEGETGVGVAAYWRLRYTSPDGSAAPAAGSVTADAVLSVFEQGSNVTIAKNLATGKLSISSNSSNAGGTAPDLSGYYNKAESDTKYAAKAAATTTTAGLVKAGAGVAVSADGTLSISDLVELAAEFAGADNQTATLTIWPAAAGTYALYSATGVNVSSYQKNSIDSPLPITVAAGDKITILGAGSGTVRLRKQ